MLRHLLANRENWEKTAVIDGDARHSVRALAQKAAALARRMDGVPHGNVAIFLPNGADYIAALFGVFMTASTAFPIHVQLTAPEIMPLLELASVHTVVTSVAYHGFFEQQGLPNPTVELIFMEELAELRLDAPPAIQDRAAVAPLVLLMTSGTTGSAKLVQLSQMNIETTVLGFIAYNDYARFRGAEIRYLLGTPFSSVYGLLILPVCLLNAFPLVLYGGTLTPDLLYSAAERHGVTHYEGGTSIPILMDQMREKAITYNISSIRFVGFGGSKVSADVLCRLEKAFPRIEFCPGYGMTESAALIARPYKRVNPTKRDSIGRAIPNVTVRVEVDGIITDAPNTVGELVVKGPNIMLGYYQNQEETNRILKNGWLYTGDIGYADEEGELFLCGRRKNVIMIRGFSVYAEELEAGLQSSGLVKECRVYGEEGPDGAEVLCADVVPQTTEVRKEDIRLWCNGNLANYKQPQKINFVNTISKTATGKTGRAAGDRHGAD